MKKKLFVPLIALLVICLLAVPASATETSGSCGYNSTWRLEGDTLIISGTGGILQYNPGEAPWSGLGFTTLIVEPGITQLSNNAFEWSESLTTVVLPEGLTVIPYGLFRYCGNLTSVTLPQSLREIHTDAFEYCENLTDMVLPSGLTVLEDSALSDCGLISVTIPSTITAIPNNLFYGCTKLQEVNLPDTIQSFGSSAFSGCTSLTTVQLPEGLTFIESGLFSGSGITHITIPDTVEHIYGSAFAGCVNLTQITLPEALRIIDAHAFNHAGLTEIVIPDSVTHIGIFAFAYCPNLASVTLPSNPDTVYEENIFTGCDSLAEFVLPGSFGTVPPSFFYGSSVIRVVLGEGITEIGYGAFQNCTALEEVVLPQSLRLIDAMAFYGCTNLKTIELPSGLTQIRAEVFFSSGLETITIPEGITTIEASTFFMCSNLREVFLPETLTTIESNAFFMCPALTKVVIPNGLRSISDSAFDTSPNVTIHCYEMSVAHLFALGMELPVEFLPPLPEDCYHSVDLNYNASGTAQITADSAYPGQVVLVSVLPNEDRVLASLVVYYDSEEELELYVTDLGDGIYSFVMPDCAVYVDILFLKPTNPFVDVKVEDYFLVPVLWAYSDGITAGTAADRFSPEDGCTRAQVVTFLWRAMGQPEPVTTENPFTDVNESEYYYKAVLWAMENGITAGTSATAFSPDQVCTRAQVATFLWRLYGCPDPSLAENPFTDVKPGEYYTNAVLWAVEYGITAGTGNGKFSPDDTCTRGQIVTFLYRALG